MEFDREKFKRLVHYVIWKAGKRDWFGATKLNKVLWFAESRAYVLTGRSITGATYTRQQYGPVPHPIMPIREELEREGAIRVTREGKLERIVALLPPESGILTADEKSTVDWWIDHISNDHTAGSISEASHDYAWEIAEMGEPLPMFAAFANRVREQPSREALQWAREVAARHGLT